MIGCPEAVESLAMQRDAPLRPARDYLAAWMAGAWGHSSPRNGCWCALIKIAWPANPCQIHHLKLKLFCSGTHSGSTANDPSAIWHAAEQVLLLRAQLTGDAAIILKSWPWMIFYMTFSMYIRRCNPRYNVCNKKDMFLWIENEKFAKQMILW